MKFKSFIKKAAVLSTLLPAFAFAQGFNSGYLTGFIDSLKEIVQKVIPLLVAVAIVFFLWEIVMFIKSKKDGDAKAMEQARMGVIWSLVGLFIMLSFMGLIRILQGATGTGQGGNINANDLPSVTF